MDKPYINNFYDNSTFNVTVKSELEVTVSQIYTIVYPVIFVIGLIGNILSSLLFSFTELSQTSCGVYFLLLAISDSIALIGGLHHYFIIGYHIRIPSAAYCRARNFLVYASTDLVSWMIVAISVDRYLRVKFPIKARLYCTQKLARYVVCMLVFVFTAKNVHLATKFIGDFTQDAADNCDPDPAYPKYVEFFGNIWPWIDLTTFVLLPFIIVTYCNTFIINDLYRRRAKFGYRALDRSLIRLLLISSISLMICHFPISIIIVIYPYISSDHVKKQTYDEVSFIFDLLRIPSYASLALNFYLYYYSSSLFRHQATLLFKRLCRIEVKKHDIHTMTYEMSRTRSPGRLSFTEDPE